MRLDDEKSGIVDWLAQRTGNRKNRHPGLSSNPVSNATIYPHYLVLLNPRKGFESDSMS